MKLINCILNLTMGTGSERAFVYEQILAAN
jgi:hypothetical protein